MFGTLECLAAAIFSTDLADCGIVVTQEHDLIARGVRDLGEPAEGRVFGVKEGVESPSRHQVLGLDVVSVAVEYVQLIRPWIRHLLEETSTWRVSGTLVADQTRTVPVLVVVGQVVAEAEDLEGFLVRHMHNTLRRHRDGRHQAQDSGGG
ncbi:hypothetical protein E2C01_039329 [Portunus trituberculatus]|uniref:Uncharacterized protein n=1 Tax=Portunus trituberculatus TaxID=210409 RepID=A0A5B7FKF1_PORTR|nr:hypothetical protein [Portunus trituberculatus]